jgi:hypothetical protein
LLLLLLLLSVGEADALDDLPERVGEEAGRKGIGLEGLDVGILTVDLIITIVASQDNLI